MLLRLKVVKVGRLNNSQLQIQNSPFRHRQLGTSRDSPSGNLESELGASKILRIFVNRGSEYKMVRGTAATKMSAKPCHCFLIRTVKHCEIDLRSVSLGIPDDRNKSDACGTTPPHPTPQPPLQHSDTPHMHCNFHRSLVRIGYISST